MTTPGKKPPMDYDESEFDYGATACMLCDATTELVDTGGTYVMQINHDDTCPVMLALYEKDES